MMTLDCRGQQCPQPVVQVRRRLLEAPGEALQVLVSEAAARDNVSRLAASLGCTVKVTADGEGFSLALTPAAPAAASLASAPAAGPTVVLIAADRLGEGDPQLGEALMKSFLFTLAESAPAPDLLLFVNGGARLTVAGSPVLEALGRLAEQGTDIATCGLCLDFFHLKEQLAIGRVGNMLETVTALRQAGRLIRP